MVADSLPDLGVEEQDQGLRNDVVADLIGFVQLVEETVALVLEVVFRLLLVA